MQDQVNKERNTFTVLDILGYDNRMSKTVIFNNNIKGLFIYDKLWLPIIKFQLKIEKSVQLFTDQV